MKKVIGILLVFAVILVGYYIFANAEMTMVKNNETIEFDVVHGMTGSNVDELINEWCEAIHRENAKFDTIDENGYFTGSGVLDMNEFEEEYGMPCNSWGMEKVLNEQLDYDLKEFNITVAGYIGDYSGSYTIYKMEAKTESKPIGYVYIDGEHVDYYEGCVYFMVYDKD